MLTATSRELGSKEELLKRQAEKYNAAKAKNLKLLEENKELKKMLKQKQTNQDVSIVAWILLMMMLLFSASLSLFNLRQMNYNCFD